MQLRLTCSLNNPGYPLSFQETLQNIHAVLRSNDHTTFVAVIEDKIVGCWLLMKITGGEGLASTWLRGETMGQRKRARYP